MLTECGRVHFTRSHAREMATSGMVASFPFSFRVKNLWWLYHRTMVNTLARIRNRGSFTMLKDLRSSTHPILGIDVLTL